MLALVCGCIYYTHINTGMVEMKCRHNTIPFHFLSSILFHFACTMLSIGACTCHVKWSSMHCSSLLSFIVVGFHFSSPFQLSFSHKSIEYGRYYHFAHSCIPNARTYTNALCIYVLLWFCLKPSVNSHDAINGFFEPSRKIKNSILFNFICS